MRSFNKLIALILVVATTLGCNKKLDITPAQNITPEQIQNGDDVKAVLFGAYSLLQSPNGFGEQYFLTSDLLANTQQVSFVGTFAPYRDLVAKRQIPTNTIASGMWANSYNIINTLNTVLNKIDLVDADEREAVEGEAKLLRGIVYFELVNYFGLPYSAGATSTNLGVPLVLEPVYEYDESKHKPSRATVEQVYTQVLSDLNDAEEMLGPDKGANGRGDRFTALAFLSRVYMNMGNYSAAASAANEVIESGEFGLNNTYPGAFNNANNTAEDVFAIQQTSQSNAGTTNNGINTFYAAYTLEPPLISGRGDVQASAAYYSRFEPGDSRGEFNYDGENIAGVAGIFTTKWQQFYKAIPVVRLAEMYLTRGEANFRGGTQIGPNTPLEDVNEVRERAGASLLPALTSEAIVEERFLELGFEGDRLWTLKRLKLNAGGKAYNDGLLVLPIPQRETDVNSNLVQNEPYN
ncbi:MAG: RagB/SusD family nutrient uptake outer membrane protein [Pedobacter sp.]|nr:MAG: RagB/SusD family nutrient uptake outer membrane protein [Pedobacter sp.]